MGSTAAVVSYRNSTSNHNYRGKKRVVIALYLIEILHQTTTMSIPCVLIICCILSKFYIKPQPGILFEIFMAVVSYRNSTSNHNPPGAQRAKELVVSYRNSTSNHNNARSTVSYDELYLIEILHQTTTPIAHFLKSSPLYLIEILHQTTTSENVLYICRKLYLIEILHQTTT